MNKVMVYTEGLVFCSVCAPKDMPIEQVTKEVNRISPTMIKSDWRLSTDVTFKDGRSNPCVCEVDSARQHYLFNC